METNGTRSPRKRARESNSWKQTLCTSMPGNWDGIALPRCISVRSIIKQARMISRRITRGGIGRENCDNYVVRGRVNRTSLNEWSIRRKNERTLSRLFRDRRWLSVGSNRRWQNLKRERRPAPGRLDWRNEPSPLLALSLPLRDVR